MTTISPPPLDSRTAVAGAPSADALGRRWLAVHEAAAVVASMAGLRDDPLAEQAADFPQALRQAGGWRLTLAAQGVEDLAALLEPGLSALLGLHRSGRDHRAAAGALWDEFAAARAALVAMVPRSP